MNWTWDEAKNEINKAKHGISFETASLVFDDPWAIFEHDPYPYEQRFRITGMIHGVVIQVVYTLDDDDFGEDDELGRIISARRATRRERLRYEESEN